MPTRIQSILATQPSPWSRGQQIMAAQILMARGLANLIPAERSAEAEANLAVARESFSNKNTRGYLRWRDKHSRTLMVLSCCSACGWSAPRWDLAIYSTVTGIPIGLSVDGVRPKVFLTNLDGFCAWLVHYYACPQGGALEPEFHWAHLTRHPEWEASS